MNAIWYCSVIKRIFKDKENSKVGTA